MEQWEKLYFLAKEFRDLEPWTWMWDSDLFGIQNPVTGEIGYCCVIGKLGECFGLVVYLGTEGLEGYLQMKSYHLEPDKDKIMHVNNCLMASFEDRSFLSKEDLEIIKNIGINFRGKNSWPQFRSYKPGYHPWYLSKEEIEYLTLCLKEAKEVALRFKGSPNLLHSPKENFYFVRVPEKEGNSYIYKDTYLEPLPLRRIVKMTKTIPQYRLEKIKRLHTSKQMIWEVDSFYAPACIKEKDKRPYFPVCIIFVEQASFFILHSHMTTKDKYRTELIDELLNSIEKIKTLPSEIQIKNEELLAFLEPITKEFSIKLKLVKRLKAVEDVKRSMRKFFKAH